ncbi:hypothetical protein [Streptomyces sp. NPDC059918]|uniref:hypothetical protein n=1 Tax=unclassified Streptomyces TaxID=2593676 RepID=UPI003648BF96
MFPYVGSGPYCFSDSLSMALGPDSPGSAVLEVLTGSPFGFQLIGGTLPFFDPFGWDPELGLTAALDLLGFDCRRSDGDTAADAETRLRAAVAEGPVLVGPLEMGLLWQEPGSGTAVGADHYVLVVEVDTDVVVFHDPHGHPWATLPMSDFLVAWRAEEISYVERPFVLRSRFSRTRDVTPAQAVRASLPRAVRLLEACESGAAGMSPASLGGGAALERLADLVAQGLDEGIRGVMARFSVRAGARRLSDAAVCLAGLGCAGPAEVLTRQARILGALQLPLITEDDAALEAGLRRLAPTYAELREALAKELAAERELRPAGTPARAEGRTGAEARNLPPG